MFNYKQFMIYYNDVFPSVRSVTVASWINVTHP